MYDMHSITCPASDETLCHSGVGVGPEPVTLVIVDLDRELADEQGGSEPYHRVTWGQCYIRS